MSDGIVDWEGHDAVVRRPPREFSEDQRNFRNAGSMRESWLSSALYRGTATHTGSGPDSRWHDVPHYPIPTVFKGHLTMPSAKVINGDGK